MWLKGDELRREARTLCTSPTGAMQACRLVGRGRFEDAGLGSGLALG
jgi:hypothetical protein